MRKTLVIAVVVAAIGVGAVGGWHWWTDWRWLQSTDDAYVASDVTIISPKVEGYIKEVRVGDNQRVKKGDVLFVIDDSDFAAKVAQAQAAVDSADASVTTYDSRLDLQRAMIDQAKAEILAAQAELTRAKQDFERYSQLLASDYASRQRYEQAKADNAKAAAALAQKQAALVAAEGNLRVLRAQRDEQKAVRQQAKANLRLAQNDLANAVIRAPIAGVAGNRAGQVGQYVKAGTQLLSLVPLPYVYVTANFKETQLTLMRPGQPAQVSVDAYPDRPIEGRIDSFAPGSGAQFSLLPPDNATGNFTKIVQRVPVRIALPAEGPLAPLLRPGLSVVVTVDTRQTAIASSGGVLGAAAAERRKPQAQPGR
jgi:membrane fusion protein (multidrug efflux system)